MKYNHCPQCSTKLVKKVNKTKNYFSYKCSDCKYNFTIADKIHKISFMKDNSKEYRIIATIRSASYEINNGRGYFVFKSINRDGTVPDQVDGSSYSDQKKQEISSAPQKDAKYESTEPTYVIYTLHYASYWIKPKEKILYLEPNFTTQEFYDKFCSWFNS